MWKVRLTGDEAPALGRWLAAGDARLGDIMRSPEDRDQPLHAVPLFVLRGGEGMLAPGDDLVPAPDDAILLAGRSSARRALETTPVADDVREHVIFDRHMPSSWIWRRLTGHTAAPTRCSHPLTPPKLSGE